MGRLLVTVYTSLDIGKLVMQRSLVKIGKAIPGTHTLPDIISVFMVGRNIMCMKEP